jgi:hypothetical protein
LSQGFGTSQRTDLTLVWFETGLEAEAAAAEVFAPGLPDRTALIRKAAYTVAVKPDLAAPSPVLPVFSLTPPAATGNR